MIVEMEALARLADRRAIRVVVVAAIQTVAAGVLSAGVADRLDPYGADDPDTESVIADEMLQEAGFRKIGVVVLVEGVNVRSQDGRRRVEDLARRLEGDPDVASVSSFVSTGSPDFISRDGDSTYLTAALRPTEDDARQDAGARIAGSLAGEPGISVGGPAVAENQVNEQVEQDLRTAELFAFP